MQNKGRTWRKRQNKAAKPKAASLSHEQEYIVLFQWAKKNGVVFHKMKPCIFPRTGRGLMATRHINAGDLLISVPKRLLVTDQMLRHSYLGGVCLTERCDLTTTDLLCLFLVVEKSLSDGSFWSPYISMLPTEFNTPAYFNQQELEQAPDFLTEQGKSQLKTSEKCFNSLKLFMNDFFINKMIKNIKLTLDDVRWAWNVVNTRSVYMNCGPILSHSVQQQRTSCSLAPLLDLLNHSCDVQIKAGFSETNQCYEIHTETSFKKGRQVFINYGPHSNRKLLIEYGFILPENSHNSIDVDSKLVYNIVSKHHRAVSMKKLDIIRKYNLEETYYCSPSGLSWSLETALKMLSLYDTEVAQKSMQIDSLTLSSENKELVRIFSKEILKFILGKYCKDIARMCGESEGDKRNNLSERMGQLVDLLQQEMKVIKSALISVELEYQIS